MRTLTYLSLGAGVQSTALLVMSNLGLHGCPRADVAIFADTQDEPAYVYEHLEALEAWSEIPIRRVTAGRLSGAGEGFLRIPAFTEAPIRAKLLFGTPKTGMLRRQCTREFKINPLQREVRSLLGLAKGQRAGNRHATALIGISLDEAHRMRTAHEAWMTNRYPLIDARLKRADCFPIIEAAGLPRPKKSACVFCPFHDDAYWRELRDEHPADFEKAVAYDVAIRDSTRAGVRLPAFLHRSLKPLSEVDLTDPYEDQIEFAFGNECEGVCGV